ncbi:hypothetical protein FFLO_06219 [Filobasidium floriforme]|uniref:Major facilitator superfamily (MFS) profile domain-containing protein n=1 Tax=Filobasidium floriforme TaxID=5210 RepID=A0A8K0NN77_9TREE|nr:hypothetical protein FFLO_06219 [Filobasidium floriforme]
MSGATDRTPLLADRPTSRSTSYDTIASEDGQDKALEYNIDISKKDFVWMLTGLWSITILASLDGTIVATLLTDIGSSFHKSNLSGWLGASYLLTVCAFTPIYGRLCDIIGRRGSMMIAITFFGIGTIGCGFAPSMEALIAARAIAGMGGGGLTSIGSIVVSDVGQRKRRGLYQGMANCFFGLGAGLGGPLGGFLSSNIGWRWAFIIQIPILLISAILVWLKVHIPLKNTGETPRQKLAKVDFLGSITLVSAVSCLLVGMTLKTSADTELPWSDPKVWVLLLVSGIFAIAFVLVEKYVAKAPLMPMRLVTQRTPAAVALSNFLLSAMAFSALYNYPLFFSAVKLTSSAVAGAHLVPNSIALALGSVAAGAYMRATGKYWWMTSFMAGLAVVSSLAMTQFTVDSPDWLLWIAIVPNGFGVSGVITSTLIALIGSVKTEDMAVATGISYMFRTTGQVIGVGITSSIAQSILTKQLTRTLTGPDASEIITRIRHSTSSIAELDPATRTLAVDAYSHALHAVFWVQVGLAVAGLLACMGMREVHLPDKGPARSNQRKNDAIRAGIEE